MEEQEEEEEVEGGMEQPRRQKRIVLTPGRSLLGYSYISFGMCIRLF